MTNFLFKKFLIFFFDLYMLGLSFSVVEVSVTEQLESCLFKNLTQLNINRVSNQNLTCVQCFSAGVKSCVLY